MAETMTMHWLDWVVVALFFVLVLWVGIRSGKNINSSTDFFVGGGKIPWWMSGISHHVCAGHVHLLLVGGQHRSGNGLGFGDHHPPLAASAPRAGHRVPDGILADAL